MARNALVQLLASLLLLALLAPLASADDLTIYTGSDKYKYQGCYNETTEIPNTAHERALANGASRVFEGNMTVPMCLSFCNSGSDKPYKYAGVEYSRECWCAQYLSSLATKFDDSECDLPCDGNKGTVCGGALKLSVYMVQSGSSRAAATAWGLVVTGVLAVYMI